MATHTKKNTTKSKKRGVTSTQRVTEQAVVKFYDVLSISSRQRMPIGEFKRFDKIEISVAANAGV
jgi:hypothetical protein